VIGRNISALVAAQAAVKALNVAVSIVLVRWLGAEELGRYAYVLAFAFPFGALADFGLATLGIREASRAPADAARVQAAVGRLALVLAAAAGAAMLAVALLLGHDARTLAALALAALASLVAARTMPWLVVLTAREALGRVSLHRVVTTLVGALLTLAGLLAGGGFVTLLGAALVTGLVGWAVARALAGPPAGAPVPAMALGALLRRAVPFGALMAGFALYYRIDMVLLEWLVGAREVGLYAAAYRFLDAVILLAAALGGPLFPRLAGVAASRPDEARRLLEAAWRPLLALGVPLSLGGWLVADDLVRALFGAEFAAAGVLLRVLVWGTLPLLWVNVASHALIAGDRVMALAALYAVTTVLNVAAVLLLVPRWGALGAAVATVACEWFNLAAVVVMVRTRFGASFSPAGLWRYAVAAAGLVLAVWAAQGAGWLVAGMAGALAYAGALVAAGYRGSSDHLAVKRLLAQ
jgi:O-antigen/teichoic acid export membrane protein